MASGDQNQACAENEYGASDVEDRGAHTAGGRELCAGLVDNKNRGSRKIVIGIGDLSNAIPIVRNLCAVLNVEISCCCGFTGLYCSYTDRRGQLIIAIRCSDLLDAVRASLNTLDGNLTVLRSDQLIRKALT